MKKRIQSNEVRIDFFFFPKFFRMFDIKGYRIERGKNSVSVILFYYFFI